MYISCPECSTKFVVSPSQIGTSGRKVKCSKCSNIWHQKLEEKTKIEPIIAPLELTPLGNGVNLPALVPDKIPFYLYLTPVFLMSLIILISILLFSNNIDSMLNHDKITIQDTNISYQEELNKIVITYKVLNASSQEHAMPLVRIRLLDKNNRVVKSVIEDHSRIQPNLDKSKSSGKLKLVPGQFIQIKSELIPIPKNTHSLDITLGNKMDFILR